MKLDRDLIQGHIDLAREKGIKEASKTRKRYWDLVIENLVYDYNETMDGGRWNNPLQLNYVSKTSVMSADEFLLFFSGGFSY